MPGLKRLFFRGSSVDVTEELWATDGTPGGTGLVKDLDPGPSFPGRMLDLNDVLYFTALVADEESQAEGRLPRRVGRSDGTTDGTFFLDGPSADEYEATWIAAAGNRIVAFLRSPADGRFSLWSARKGETKLSFLADVGEWEEQDLRLLLWTADRIFFAFGGALHRNCGRATVRLPAPAWWLNGLPLSSRKSRSGISSPSPSRVAWPSTDTTRSGETSCG